MCRLLVAHVTMWVAFLILCFLASKLVLVSQKLWVFFSYCGSWMTFCRLNACAHVYWVEEILNLFLAKLTRTLIAYYICVVYPAEQWINYDDWGWWLVHIYVEMERCFYIAAVFVVLFIVAITRRSVYTMYKSGLNFRCFKHFGLWESEKIWYYVTQSIGVRTVMCYVFDVIIYQVLGSEKIKWLNHQHIYIWCQPTNNTIYSCFR